jgi:hypothetical protein
MNILGLIEADGGTLRKMATTGGGEFAGACPFCGGRDRFRVWPDHDAGRYWCRGCGKAGDSIQYLRERRGLSFLDACRLLGRDPGPRPSGPRPARPAWEPKEATAPAAEWRTRARAFLDGAIDTLWSAGGEPIRAWLHEEKGLHDATIRGAGLGFNPSDKYDSRASWGLPAAVRNDGTASPLWLPAGLVIPLVKGGDVYRLRVRRTDPGDGTRFVVVSGSSSAPMTWGLDRPAVVIVESELDGLLLNQEAGDLCGAVALGSAQAKPDTATHEALTAAAVILVSLDTDDAGARAAWTLWPATYGRKAKRWPCVNGKDPGEARAKGLDLNNWIIAGVFGTEERFERFCIQTIDGGMSDAEAMSFGKEE